MSFQNQKFETIASRRARRIIAGLLDMPKHQWHGVMEEERRPKQKRAMTPEDVKQLIEEAKKDPHLLKILKDLGVI